MGNRNCIVKGCNSDMDNPASEQLQIHFYSLPENLYLAEKWIRNLENKMKVDKFTEESRVCSLHFSEESYDTEWIPTIFPDLSKQLIVYDEEAKINAVFLKEDDEDSESFEDEDGSTSKRKKNSKASKRKAPPKSAPKEFETTIPSDNFFRKSKLAEIYVSPTGKFYAKCKFCPEKKSFHVNDILQHFIKNHTTHYLKPEGKYSTTYRKTAKEKLFYQSFIFSMNKSNKVTAKYTRHAKAQETPASFVIPVDVKEEVSVPEKKEKRRYKTKSIQPTSTKKADQMNEERKAEMYKHLLTTSIKESLKQDAEDIKFPAGIVVEEGDPNAEITDSEHIQKLDDKFYNRIGKDPTYFHCKHCNTSVRYIAKHYKSVHPYAYVCERGSCYETFDTIAELNTHTKRIHFDPVYAFTCTVCGHKSRTLVLFRTHYQRIHMNKKDFPCEICEMKFYCDSERQKHMRVHTGQKPYVCTLCGRKFACGQQLNLHIQKKHQDPQYECDICQKKLHTKRALKEHSVIHGEKKIVCHLCGDRFFKRDALKRHYTKKHEPREYKCKLCNEIFNERPQLKVHILGKHIKKKKVSSNSKKFSSNNVS
ncbi:zinc finger protein 334-like [Condylostylus longicornis]|uniref:zinc finger protein 334-like n=1 Tax=Condylostylus longicornis TaxID=2530218 RepID=UPI00244E2D54|nr:zinc finger protein 334-like [Condylostylus longicornis]